MALLALVAHFPTSLSHLLCHIALAPIALVPNLATRWSHMHWLQIWPPNGTTCIDYNLATRWQYLNQLQIWPPGGATCINSITKKHHSHLFKIWSSGGTTCVGSKVDPQVATLADATNLATRQVASLSLSHCLGLPHIGIISWY